MAVEDLVRVEEHGLYCAQAGFYIDPWKPVEKAVITHVHSDHARVGSTIYWASAKSEPLLRYRLGFDLKIESYPYGERHQGEFLIQGHVHPVITLSEGPLRMRFPCFVVAHDHLLLPSFGTWTGGIDVTRERGARYFASAPEEVFEVRV